MPVPREAITDGPGGEARLAYTAEKLAGFPAFASRAAVEDEGPPAYAPPAADGAAPTAAPSAEPGPEGVDRASRAEVGALARGRAAAIGAGSVVVGADGALAGEVEQLGFEPGDGRLTEGVVRPRDGASRSRWRPA